MAENGQIFIRLSDISKLLGIGRTKIYGLIHDGQLAKPLTIGRCSLWRRKDIEDFARRVEAGELQSH